MEWEEEGLRLSLALGNVSVLKCAALALTATVLSSLLELFAQVAVLEGDIKENGYEVVDAEGANGNNDDGDGDDGGEDDEGGSDDAEGKETKKGPVSGPDGNDELGGGDDDDEPEGDDDNDDDDDDDNHENGDDEDDGDEDEDDDEEDEDEDAEAEAEEEEEEDEEEEALQPPKKRKK